MTKEMMKFTECIEEAYNDYEMELEEAFNTWASYERMETLKDAIVYRLIGIVDMADAMGIKGYEKIYDDYNTKVYKKFKEVTKRPHYT